MWGSTSEGNHKTHSTMKWRNFPKLYPQGINWGSAWNLLSVMNQFIKKLYLTMNRINQNCARDTQSSPPSPGPSPLKCCFSRLLEVARKGWGMKAERPVKNEKGGPVVWQALPAPFLNEEEILPAAKQEKKNCEEPVKTDLHPASFSKGKRSWNQLFFLYKVIEAEIKTRHVIQNNPEIILDTDVVLLWEAPHGMWHLSQPALPHGSATPSPFPNPELKSTVLFSIDVLNNQTFS